MLTAVIRKALTKIEVRQVGKGKKLERVELPPSERLVYGLYFAFMALTALTILEALHIVFLHSFSSEIFSAVSLVVGTILGAFFGQRG